MRFSAIVLVAALLIALPAAAVPAPAAPPAAPAPGAAALSSILHPPLKIIDATVLDTNGAAIGTVQRVEVTPAGVPTAVAVALTAGPGRIEVLDAGAVAYDAARNEIIDRRPAHG